MNSDYFAGEDVSIGIFGGIAGETGTGGENLAANPNSELTHPLSEFFRQNSEFSRAPAPPASANRWPGLKAEPVAEGSGIGPLRETHVKWAITAEIADSLPQLEGHVPTVA